MFNKKASISFGRRFLIKTCLALACVPWLGGVAFADTPYPERPVKIVVGFSPGGTNDTVARLVASELQARLGQSFVVENKPGAASAIATGSVAQAKPDGYTLLVSSSGGLTVNPVLMKNLSYDPTVDFAPIALLGTFPLVVVTSPDAPYNSIAELRAHAKSHPDALNHGVASTSFQLVAETLAEKAGIKLTHVNYRGSGPTVTAVMRGEVQLALLDSAAVVGQISAGTLKALAVTTAARSKVLPDVPTVAESGIEGYEAPIWTALVAPKDTPAPVLNKLRSTMTEVLGDPKIIDRLHQLGMEPGNTDAATLHKRIVDDIILWGAVAKAANIPAR